VDVDPGVESQLVADWKAWDIGVDLVVIPSPYRSVLRPIVDYVRALTHDGDADLVTVVVSEIVPRKWWEHLLHNKTALYIRTAFLFRPNVVVTAVPYLLGHSARLSDLMSHDETLDEENGIASRAPVIAETVRG